MTSDNLIKPAFDNNNIPVVFSADDNYAPYLGVTIQSVVLNSEETKNYDLLILDGNISHYHKSLITLIIKDKKNFSVRFIDINAYLQPFKNFFYTSNHASIANYFRFFIPEIFSEFPNILYLDCDLVVLGNIAEIFTLSLENKIFGAVQDLMGHYQTGNWPSYLHNTLQIKNPNEYFNSGILFCDIIQMKKNNFTQACLDKLNEIKTPSLWDQDILNAIYHGKIKYLDAKYNVMWHWPTHPRLQKIFSADIIKKCMQNIENPLIIHYTSQIKPWNTPNQHLAEYFWKYARISPFYEEILYKNIEKIQQSKNEQILQKKYIPLIVDAINYTANKLKYWRYKLLSKITFGKKRKKYKQKRKDLKTRLKQVRKFLRKHS